MNDSTAQSNTQKSQQIIIQLALLQLLCDYFVESTLLVAYSLHIQSIYVSVADVGNNATVFHQISIIIICVILFDLSEGYDTVRQFFILSLIGDVSGMNVHILLMPIVVFVSIDVLICLFVYSLYDSAVKHSIQ